MNAVEENASPKKPLLHLGLMGKLVLIGLLVLLLQIPLWLVNSLREEREGLREKAISEITSRWGAEQVLAGPVLVIPFTYRSEQYEWEQDPVTKAQVKRQRVYQANAYFLPEELGVTVKLEPELRKRGIYTAALYSAKVSIKGRMGALVWESLGVKPELILWSQARIFMGLSDVRGLREVQSWTMDGRKKEWQPGTRWAEMKNGLHCQLGLADKLADGFPFEMELAFNGSGQFGVVPVGKNTQVSMASTWADPSFTGMQLPNQRSVGPEGFQAEWKTSYLARELPQQWVDGDKENALAPVCLQASQVGVNLLSPVDAYRTTERAIKHGILFLALVFTAFFVVENLGQKKLSFVHYALVGAAICLFYLGLLALSEFMGFAPAYALSAGAGILLISCYSSAILGGPRKALLLGAGMSLVYGYLYFVLQMQDYALLAGAAALFVALAGLMWVTRKLSAFTP